MIRKYKNNDIKAIMEIWKKENINAHSFISKSYWESNYEHVKNILPNAEVFVYLIDDEIVGFIGLNKNFIEGIFIKENYQNKGIGKELVQKAKSIRDKLTLEVYEKNLNAIRFYEKQDFKPMNKSLETETNEYAYVMEWKKDKEKKTNKIFETSFASIYPLYIQKAEKKNRTKEEVDQIICWLTGYNFVELKKQINNNVNFETFFKQAPKINPNSFLITGVICGIRVEEIEDPLMQKIRYLDKLIDELAKGKAMEKILRKKQDK